MADRNMYVPLRENENECRVQKPCYPSTRSGAKWIGNCRHLARERVESGASPGSDWGWRAGSASWRCPLRGNQLRESMGHRNGGLRWRQDRCNRCGFTGWRGVVGGAWNGSGGWHALRYSGGHGEPATEATTPIGIPLSVPPAVDSSLRSGPFDFRDELLIPPWKDRAEMNADGSVMFRGDDGATARR